MNQVLDIKDSKSKQVVAKLHLKEFNIEHRPQFIEYLRGGVELNLITAIDFTGSNGIVTSPSSLHYLNRNNPD